MKIAPPSQFEVDQLWKNDQRLASNNVSPYLIPGRSDDTINDLKTRCHPAEIENGVLRRIDDTMIDIAQMSFLWAPKLAEEVSTPTLVKRFVTLHSYGHPSLFKPSIKEVLSQIELPANSQDEQFYFTTNFIDLKDKCHVAISSLYRA